MATNTSLSASAIRHPDFLFNSTDWAEWRETFGGGKEYRTRYLKQWSDRETTAEFTIRRNCTPIPTFAKAAILDIRNSIFQRLEDVVRTGGSASYNKAVAGEGSGVDREGTSMNSFIGVDILTELLVMGRCGVYVDAPNVSPVSLADQVSRNDLAPYCYSYRVEDILSFSMDEKENPGTFAAVLLRDHVINFNTEFAGVPLPKGRESRIRLVWKDPQSGKVRVRLWKEDEDKTPIILDNADADGAVTLDIDIVPFIMPDIGESLMVDITSYQHALLNLVSGDVNWSLMSSSPFLTIQRDLRSVGAHLKKPGGGNTPEPGGQRAASSEEQIGGKGRYYDVDTDRPGYISPPTDPLLASMKLQEKLEDDIRKLVNLAVANKSGSRTESAEAKKLSSQGLEAGLSFIGLVLQDLEQHIAKIWTMYEKSGIPATIAYPERYVLKQDIERIEEASAMVKLMREMPSSIARKSMSKQIIKTLVGGRENSEVLQSMMLQIESADYTLSPVQEVIQAHASGLVGDETASQSLGYKEGEVEQAKKDKAERATITLLAQQSIGGESGQYAIGAGARGVPEIDPNDNSAVQEKETE